MKFSLTLILWSNIDFLKVLSNNSFLACQFRRWKGRPLATYVARTRPRDFVAQRVKD